MSNGSPNILIVDDAPDTVTELTQVLKHAGFTTHLTPSYQTALQYIEQNRPDLILLNTLTDQSGFQFCQHLKSETKTENIPVIITISKDIVDDQKIFTVGANDYLIKPFQPATALARINTHLALSQAQHQLKKETKQRQKAEATLQQWGDELAMLNQIAQMLNSVVDMQSTLETVAQVMRKLFEASGVAIALLNEKESELAILASYVGEKSNFQNVGLIIPLADHPLLRQVVNTPRTMIIAKETLCTMAEPMQSLLDGRDVHQLLVSPLLTRNNVNGIILIDITDPQQAFTQADANFADMIAGQIAGAIENARLFDEEQHQREFAEQRVDELSTLNLINQTMTTVEDLQIALEIIAGTMTRLFAARGTSMSLFDSYQSKLTVLAHYSKSKQHPNLSGRTFHFPQDTILLQRLFEGQSIIVTKAQLTTEDQTLREMMQSRNIEMILNVPLQARGRVIGLISMSHDQAGREFLPTEVTLAETIAGQISGAIEVSRLFQEEQKQHRIADGLRKVAAILSSSLDRNTLLVQILNQLERVIVFHSAAIFMPRGDDLALVYGVNLSEIAKGYRFSLAGDSPVVQVFRDKQTSILPDVREVPNWEMFSPDEPIRTWMGVPLVTGNQVLGVLTIDNFETDAYTEEDANIIQIFANQAAIAIENARLFDEEQHQRALAESRNKELDAFAHTVAHDIKSPLGIIVAYSDVIVNEFNEMNPERLQDFLKIVRQSGFKAANIVDELLLLAGVRKQTVHIGPIDMGDVVRHAEQRIGYLIEEHEGELIIAEDWPEVFGYAPWIEEVWVNYLSNGLKYGGQPPRLILGATIQAHSQPRFWIRDNGEGLTPEKQATLFTEFTRLDEVRADGHGLGLSIVRRIIEKLGGEVGVESDAGQGSLFYFTLPAVQSAQSSLLPKNTL